MSWDDYEYTDWNLDTIDLNFVSVKDLQKLLERESPVPVEIYRETARIDAHLLKELYKVVSSPTTLVNPLYPPSVATLPPEQTINGTREFVLEETTLPSVEYAHRSDLPNSEATNAQYPTTLVEGLNTTSARWDKFVPVEPWEFEAVEPEFDPVEPEMGAPPEPSLGPAEDTLVGQVRENQSNEKLFGVISLPDLPEPWFWISISIAVFLLMVVVALVFIKRRSSAGLHGKHQECRESTDSYSRYRPGLPDNSRFIVNLQQEQRQDTIIKIHGDPEVSGFLTHQVVPAHQARGEKAPTVLSTFSPRPCRPEQFHSSPTQDQGVENCLRSKETDNSSDLEESNSGQLCETYSEERCALPPGTREQAEEEAEDDVTETSGVLDKDEGIESEEEIDPSVFKSLILNTVRENFAQIGQHPTREKEELYAKINFDAKYRSRSSGSRGTLSPSLSLGSDGNSPTLTPPNQTNPSNLSFQKPGEFFVTSFSGSESECLI